MDTASVILSLYPNADLHHDFVVQDDGDGKGAYLAAWNLKDAQGNPIPKPTDSQIQTTWNTVQLTLTQQAKIAEIEAAAQQQMLTFKSAALTSNLATPVPYTYLLTTATDLVLIADEDRWAQGADYDGKPISWYTEENSYMMHTKDQWHRVYLDGRAWVAKVKYKAAYYVAQAQAAKTPQDVQAIDVTKINWYI